MSLFARITPSHLSGYPVWARCWPSVASFYVAAQRSNAQSRAIGVIATTTVAPVPELRPNPRAVVHLVDAVGGDASAVRAVRAPVTMPRTAVRGGGTTVQMFERIFHDIVAAKAFGLHTFAACTGFVYSDATLQETLVGSPPRSISALLADAHKANPAGYTSSPVVTRLVDHCFAGGFVATTCQGLVNTMRTTPVFYMPGLSNKRLMFELRLLPEKDVIEVTRRAPKTSSVAYISIKSCIMKQIAVLAVFIVLDGPFKYIQ